MSERGGTTRHWLGLLGCATRRLIGATGDHFRRLREAGWPGAVLVMLIIATVALDVLDGCAH